MDKKILIAPSILSANFADLGIDVKKIEYRVSHFYALNEQVYSFSALILYEKDSLE